jgi:uncharacterized membrane protein
MVVLAGLVYLPVTAIATFGVGMIALHNLLDGIQVAGWQGPGSPVPSAAARLWMILHQSNQIIPLFTWPGPVVWLIYPLVPWIGVMAAGYAFGRVYDLDPVRRRHVLLRTGTALIAAFVVIRGLNVYGDPAPWQVQTSAVFTVLSFVNTTKYPPHLRPCAAVLLSAAVAGCARHRDRGEPGGREGRGLLLRQPAGILHGDAAGRRIRPVDGVLVLGGGVAAILVLYMLCVWYADVKRRHPRSLLRYL